MSTKYRLLDSAMSTEEQEDAGDYHVNRGGPVLPTGHRDLDDFFCRVYAYFEGQGFWCILLSYIFNILTLAFVMLFSLFLVSAVDYRGMFRELDADEGYVRLGDYIKIDTQLPAYVIFCIVVCAVFWLWYLLRFLLFEIRRLLEMRKMYRDVFRIDEAELSSMKWDEVVKRIEAVPTHERVKLIPPTHRVSALYIASRIMRRDNFLIALYNEDKIGLRLPVPGLRDRVLLTRSVEWVVNWCLLDFIFDRSQPLGKAQLRKEFQQRSEENIATVAAFVRRRFILVGAAALLLSPFIACFVLLFFFFKYGEELYKNPGSLGMRSWSPYARWLFREYNELPHVFQARLNASYEKANDFANMSNGGLTVVVARFVAFIAGAFAAVFIVLSIVDQRALLNLEVTSGQTIVWYVGLCGIVLAAARAVLPAPHALFTPDETIKLVKDKVHWLPDWDEWREGAHRRRVQAEFQRLFDFRLLLFVYELLSVVFIPIVCWLTLARSSREMVTLIFNVRRRVSGLGDVCKYAHWEDAVDDARPNPHTSYWGPRAMPNEKSLQSLLNFKLNHPDWVADARGEELMRVLQGMAPLSPMAGGSVPAGTASATAGMSTGGLSYFSAMGHSEPTRPVAPLEGLVLTASQYGGSSIVAPGPAPAPVGAESMYRASMYNNLDRYFATSGITQGRRGSRKVRHADAESGAGTGERVSDPYDYAMFDTNDGIELGPPGDV